MVAKIILCISTIGYLMLAGCESYVSRPCGVTTKSIEWKMPEKWETTLTTRIYLSKDGNNWELKTTFEKQTLAGNWVQVECDTCGATYWLAKMSDGALCSLSAGCIGDKCQRISIDGLECKEF